MTRRPLLLIHGHSADAGAFTPCATYRCLHIRLTPRLMGQQDRLKIRIHASSGTNLIGYQGYTEKQPELPLLPQPIAEGSTMTAAGNAITLPLSDLGPGTTLFYPFTTTLIELRISREPIPLASVSPVLQFVRELAPPGKP